MNNRSYKLVFNKKRGMLVAVSEITTADGKGVGEGTVGTATETSEERRAYGYSFKFSPLELAAKFMLGTALIVGGSATAQIINDPNQSGSKPVIGVTGNGVPIINIVAPNNSGVSLNQFQQYNVNSNGAILNNSGGMSQTQLAGKVQGNQ